MPFGITGASHAKVAERLDVGHEIRGIAVIAGRNKVGITGLVSPEGENVVHILFLEFGNDPVDLVFGRGIRGEMGDRGYADGLQVRGNANGVRRSSATRSVGYADKVRIEFGEFVRTAHDSLYSRVLPRREYFK